MHHIYVVDDGCPEKQGPSSNNIAVHDARVKVIYHECNKGVGGAVLTGYAKAIVDGANIIVKLDGDGQMNPDLIPNFIQPILDYECDYTKGNRFYDARYLREMPAIRIFGNAVLSFFTKFSTGYWNLFDPTNGYTAIHSAIASRLVVSKISHRYFFESDILFRLSIIRAAVQDVPMESRYRDEVSNLRVRKILFEFLFNTSEMVARGFSIIIF